MIVIEIVLTILTLAAAIASMDDFNGRNDYCTYEISEAVSVQSNQIKSKQNNRFSSLASSKKIGFLSFFFFAEIRIFDSKQSTSTNLYLLIPRPIFDRFFCVYFISMYLCLCALLCFALLCLLAFVIQLRAAETMLHVPSIHFLHVVVVLAFVCEIRCSHCRFSRPTSSCCQGRANTGQ
jgi:hypothetical protein